jgi:hypothetical protein
LIGRKAKAVLKQKGLDCRGALRHPPGAFG